MNSLLFQPTQINTCPKKKIKKNIYLGLGGNEGSVLETIKKSMVCLKNHLEVFDFTHSHFYHSSPLEMICQDLFVNAVCCFKTTLSLKELFVWIQEIERQLGKVKKAKNASRPIDIDILFYDTMIYSDEELMIPHPEWMNRLFVLKPLADLTDQILLQDRDQIQVISIPLLVQQFLNHSSQSISLFEENPDIQ